MSLGESGTRAKLIGLAIHARSWTEELVRCEETAGAFEIIDGKPRKQAKGRVDYVLRIAAEREERARQAAAVKRAGKARNRNRKSATA